MERSSGNRRPLIGINKFRQYLLLRTDIIQKKSRWVPLVLDFHVELNLRETFLALTDELSYTKYCKYPLL